jgi:hypothetical protein
MKKLLIYLTKKDGINIRTWQKSDCLKSSPIQELSSNISFSAAIITAISLSPLLSSPISCPVFSLLIIPLTGYQVSSILSIIKEYIHLDHIICAFIS